MFSNKLEYVSIKVTGLIVLSLILLLGGCANENNEILYFGYVEGTFSIREFELRIDSSFSYRVRKWEDDILVKGRWDVSSDTIFLFDNDNEDIYGVLINRKDNLEADFIRTEDNEVLKDMDSDNFKIYNIIEKGMIKNIKKYHS